MDFHRRLQHSSRPGSAYFVTWRLDGSLPVTRVADLWTSDGPKFVELDQLLDAVSIGPRWLERRDVAGVVVNALWKGARESRYELGARDGDHEGRVTRYIENNPVKAGLCGSVQDWPWSSARKNAA